MRLTVAFVVVVLAASSLGAQTPVRDPARVVLVGSAVVSGIVVADDETRAPLRNAFVTLERIGVEDIRSTPTDNQGRFAFDRLPSASYALGASKGGYIFVEYGAPKPGMTGSPIALSDGQMLETKPMALMRGGVIAGRLFDRHGLPVSGASVTANRFAVVSGERRRRLTQGSAKSATTNAHGEYRIHGLLPGEYLVYGDTPGFAVANEVTAQEIRWANQPVGPSPPSGRPFSYAPAIFPGTSDAAAAVPIVLGRGEERLGVDFVLQFVPTARAAGVVTGVDGRPVPNTTVRAVPKQPNQFTSSTVNSGRTGPDGGFVFQGLPPGEHRFTAQGGQVATPIAAGGSLLNSTQWGRADVTLAGQDISDIAIRLQVGGSVAGSLVFRGAATTPRPDLTRVLVQMGSSTYANSDGTFKIDGIAPDEMRLNVTMPPPAGSTASLWFARSAMHDGKDLLDHRLEVAPGAALTGIVVTLTDEQTRLSGTLTDATGRPAPDFYVLLFSTERAHWTSISRRTRFVHANDAGAYAINGLPPGEYYLCALTEIDMEMRFEPTYLEQLVSAAIKITLGEGEKKTQDLRVSAK